MNIPLMYRPLKLVNKNRFTRDAIRLWQQSMAESFPIKETLWRRQIMDSVHTDWNRSVAVYYKGRLIGFMIMKRCQEAVSYEGVQNDHYWISCLLIDPQFRRLGIGTTLFKHIQLTIHHPVSISVGSDLDHLFPGIPAENTVCRAFFKNLGFQEEGEAYDLRCTIKHYKLSQPLPRGYVVRRLIQSDYPALDLLLRTQFSARWHYDALRSLNFEKPIDSIIGLFHDSKLIGFAHLYRYDQPFYGGSVYWSDLLKEKHGGLGPIGIDKQYRGKGLGKAFFDHAVYTLSQEGVEDMVVDWTILVKFYGAYGFTPWKRYIHARKKVFE